MKLLMYLLHKYHTLLAIAPVPLPCLRITIHSYWGLIANKVTN